MFIAMVFQVDVEWMTSCENDIETGSLKWNYVWVINFWLNSIYMNQKEQFFIYPVQRCLQDQYLYWSRAILHLSHCIFNSFAPGRFQIILRKVIFQQILVIDGWRVSCKIVLKWMPTDLTDGKSTLVQIMAWCRQATSHYLSQCWPISVSPYGVIRPQWVNTDLITLSWMLSNGNTINLNQLLMSNNWPDDNHKFTWPIVSDLGFQLSITVGNFIS